MRGLSEPNCAGPSELRKNTRALDATGWKPPDRLSLLTVTATQCSSLDSSC
jgi:hypothetical protein